MAIGYTNILMNENRELIEDNSRLKAIVKKESTCLLSDFFKENITILYDIIKTLNREGFPVCGLVCVKGYEKENIINFENVEKMFELEKNLRVVKSVLESKE